MDNIAPLILEEASNNDAIETIVKAYYGDQDANQKFQKAYIERLCDRSFHQKVWGAVQLNLFPLSFGTLKAEGLCSIAFGRREDVQVGRQPWYTNSQES